MVALEDAAFLLVLDWIDAFRYLFEGKGTRPSFGQGKNYEKDDFDQRFFPTNWDKVYDHLGDGCVVQYPAAN